ncbi:carboxypeptidase-like regulatory domain-containing protein [Niabella hibiscisoli]|uniref:carboxypeptidase-like regulatory domain-containing protein n=1 Tax=Niabella hibiscisoli TaxID=1825928 RepID=UPI001F0D9025|nr:carboxypeptidase-like regulatory domain-containing protein [Niabella hibiscisoli]MCH5715856.1 carboxypeptidase-like regulatory domain-containing protein [Niabella hibiscisoli]
MNGKTLTLFFMLLCCPFFLPAQTRQITGTVKNSGGEPVANATVIQKGTNNTTMAGEDGRFSLTVTGANIILSVSAVNYQDVEVNAGTQTVVDIILPESTTTKMDEVFVVAYGTAKKVVIPGPPRW